MSTATKFRYHVDLPEWRSLSQPITQLSTASPVNIAGAVIAEDYRCRDYASPLFLFQGGTANVMSNYNTKYDAWFPQKAAMGMGGTFGAGATAVFCPMFSPYGTLAAGNTTRKVVLSTALLAAVAENQLSNRGDGQGFIIRIIGNTAGSSGKIEERRVIANTSGTTPTIYLDRDLSFTPATGDRYEFLSGSVLFLNTGALAANQFRRYDLLTNSFVSLSTTNLISTVAATHNQLIATDEQYVASDRNPGEGYIVSTATYDAAGQWVKNCLVATGTSATTLTGHEGTGDASVVANQFRNYQIRIVEDTTEPRAVGQRRRITSHTAGTSPVYTLSSSWGITPSATCKYVIENATDNVIGFMGGATITYNYKINDFLGATANTWDAGTTWAARSVAFGQGGLTTHVFGIPFDSSEGVNKSSIITSLRTATVFDVFNISGGANGSWTNGVTPLNSGSGLDNFVLSSDFLSYAYNPHTENGRFAYFFGAGSTSSISTQRPITKLDLTNFSTSPVAGPKQVTGNVVPVYANGGFTTVFQDGTTKIAFYNMPRPMSSFSDYLQLMLI